MSNVGRQSTLEQGKYEEVLSAVSQVLIQRHVAALAKVPESTLITWLTRGRNDQENDIESVYASFSRDYHSERAKVIRDKLEIISRDPENRAGNCWILERCFREDFGKDSEEIRELRAMLTQLLTMKGDQNGKA